MGVEHLVAAHMGAVHLGVVYLGVLHMSVLHMGVVHMGVVHMDVFHLKLRSRHQSTVNISSTSQCTCKGVSCKLIDLARCSRAQEKQSK